MMGRPAHPSAASLQRSTAITMRQTAAALMLLLLLAPPLAGAQDRDPATYNGGSCLAMAGRGCAALAVDRRLGTGLALVGVRPRPVLLPAPRVLLAATGLQGDVEALQRVLAALVDGTYARGLGVAGAAATAVSARAVASLTSHVLYDRRNAPYYVEPIVVGLEAAPASEAAAAEGPGAPCDGDADCRPYLCSMDCIGAQSASDSFVCSGAAARSLYGTAEALWRPDLPPDELVAVCARAFTSALERDCLSGYGAMIYLITAEGVTEYDVAGRND